MQHIVYLDNSSTTKPCKRAVEYMNNALTQTWGNPSSLHSLGIESEAVVNDARSKVAGVIKALPEEIIFTASGTEANNTAIMSAENKSWGNRIITTKIEHPSVLETVKRLEQKGFEVIRLGCDEYGVISLSELEAALNEKTVLVSIMLVNNEIGAIQPIEEASRLIKRLSPRALFHCDAVQAYGKMPINVKTLGVDMLSVSGHKIHAPKGIGFLYCKKGIKIPPFVTGGGQEKGMRSGTESVPLIASFKGAVEELPDSKAELSRLNKLWDYAECLFKSSGFIEINSPKGVLPYILNISVTGFRSETLLHFLEAYGIFVSSGSACAKGKMSYVLEALGFDRKRADSALRLSFSRETTQQDIDEFYNILRLATEKLRRSDK